MRKQEPYKNLLKAGMSFVIWSAMVFVWAWFWMEHYAEIILRPFGYKGNWLVIAVYGLLLLLFTSFYGGYRIGYYRRDNVILSAVLAMMITNGVTYLQTCLVGRGIMDVRPILMMTGLQVVLIFLWSFAADKIYQKIVPPYHMILIYGGTDLAKSLTLKMLSRSEKYNIKEVVNISDGMGGIVKKLSSYEAAVLCDLPPQERNTILKYCFKQGIRTYTTPKISDILIRGATDVNLFDSPLLLNRNGGLTPEQRLIKRSMDLVLSLIGLVITSPFMLLTAIAVKACDGGPVIFRQERCTIDNRVFTLLKFRSMVVDAEKDGKSRPAVEEDPRITPVGKLIRLTRLDELPQLWNILKGEMSFVGPRPERIEHVEKYTEEIPEFSFRSKVKAGLTGYAQVVGRYNTSPYDKLKMDLMYISNYSLVEDLKLMLMTVKILFVRESTQGFERPAEEPR